MKSTLNVLAPPDDPDAMRPPSYLALTAADLIDRATIEACICRRLPYSAGREDAIAVLLAALYATPAAGRC